MQNVSLKGSTKYYITPFNSKTVLNGPIALYIAPVTPGFLISSAWPTFLLSWGR